MGSERVSHVDDPEVEPTCPLPNFGGAAKGPFEELDGIPIFVEEDSGAADQWLAELETDAVAIAELAGPGSGPPTRCGPEGEDEGPEGPRSSRLVINLVSREASFDAPLLKQRGGAAMSVELPRASILDALGVELAIVPSESFLDEIYSDDSQGSGSETLEEDSEAPPASWKEKHDGEVLAMAWPALESAEASG